jgi:hypothetical protein
MMATPPRQASSLEPQNVRLALELEKGCHLWDGEETLSFGTPQIRETPLCFPPLEIHSGSFQRISK